MKKETKGTIIIAIGTAILVITLLAMTFEITQGPESFLATLVSLFLIYEGIKIRKGKKSSIFDIP